ncbi:2OG-Fe(II) oxygenase [Parablastomonas sp. CN1-191]|uniref:2OG-Fe(II) oxygenase n=1 Tax=Parablastomonas sp. CN1-191 TaxID=3400908 RepID=UPI003BF8779A
MTESAVRSYPNPDRAALIRAGNHVRKKLDGRSGVERVVSDKVEMFTVAGFLSVEECGALCRMIDRTARPSTVYDHGYPADYRTSWSGDIDGADPVVQAVVKRIDALLGIPGAYGEPVQGQRYLAGQQYKQHNDWFYTLAPYWKAEAKRGGQRCFTAMAYLNAVEEGGSTDFTRAGFSVPPQAGSLLIWNNATTDGFPNEDAMHAGTPVIKGAKYVITKWYRTRKWG